MRWFLSKRTAKRPDSGESQMDRLNRDTEVYATILVALLVAVISSLVAWADDGKVVGVQCWENGVLVGHPDPNYRCSGRDIIMGPPVIVWRRPSAEGSQMQGLSTVDSGLASQLSAVADTSITLRQKAQFAMKNGDLVRARQYLNEASRRNPVDPQVESVREELDALFDKGTHSLTVPRLQLSEQEFLKPMPLENVNKFLNRPGVKNLRDAEINAYNKLANADAALSLAMKNSKTGAVKQEDVDQAQSKLNKAVEEFKQAQTKLKEKIYILEK